MSDSNSGDSRAYSSPVRDRRKAATRDKVLDAVVDVILNDGVHAFSVQTVADRAGVSHRTVYRHFESRDGLLDALAMSLEEEPGEGQPAHVGELPDRVRRYLPEMSEHRDRARATVIASIALGLEVGRRRSRTAMIRRLVDEGFPHLDDATRAEAAAVLRTVIGSRMWFLLDEAGLSPERSADASARLAQFLIDDYGRRDAAAREETR